MTSTPDTPADQGTSGSAATPEPTTQLVEALEAVNAHVPRIIMGLVINDLSPLKQHAFAALLIELGELLHHHADDQTPPNGRQRLSEPAALSPDAPGPALS
jgi:hypothetical protein